MSGDDLRPDLGPSPAPFVGTTYAVGVHRLLSGRPDALGLLGEAVRKNPHDAVARAALACAYALAGDRANAEASRSDALGLKGATRQERQHVEILNATLEGHVVQALGLAFEHHCEFGVDRLVLHMLSDAVSRSGDPGLWTELRALVDLVHPPLDHRSEHGGRKGR